MNFSRINATYGLGLETLHENAVQQRDDGLDGLEGCLGCLCFP